MRKIGLTGSIGSGKSLVASLFAETGVPVYHADEEAKRFYQYPAIIARLREHFGENMLNDQGGIDKARLAGVVFSDPAELKWLSALIHPLVKSDFNCWCDLHHGVPYVLHEAAIIFESGFDVFFDRIILVTAPRDIRIARVMKRDAVTETEVLRRMSFQWEEEKKIPLADYLISNSGKEMLLPQVAALHQSLSEFS
jgi:dephospho-CoA kinase